jgi:hypothetical protein
VGTRSQQDALHRSKPSRPVQRCGRPSHSETSDPLRGRREVGSSGAYGYRPDDDDAAMD